jgi:hypothetical protein
MRRSVCERVYMSTKHTQSDRHTHPSAVCDKLTIFLIPSRLVLFMKRKSEGSNKTKAVLNAFLVCAQAPSVIFDFIKKIELRLLLHL